MKNPYYQFIRRAAKKFHRQQYGDNFIKGIMQDYVFSEQKVDELSQYEDVMFILNDYRVQVFWSHPRWQYHETINAQVLDSLDIGNNLEDAFKNAVPNYKKIGQSRKKKSSFTVGNLLKAEIVEAFESERLKVLETSDLKTYPSIDVKWFKNCRYVEICAPIEIRKIEDLNILVTLVRKLLRYETTLEHEFQKYSYSRTDWKREHI